jgi:Flp pilus assembly protein TadD
MGQGGKVMRHRVSHILVPALAAAAICAAPSVGVCAKAAPRAVAPIEDIQAALSEQRLVDAARMIDQSLIAGDRNPMLLVLSGELNLARGRHDAAREVFKQAQTHAEVRTQALQGLGVSLSLLGKSEEALRVLKDAVAADGRAWRAWNALGQEHDRRQEWQAARVAYDQAVATSGGSAIALNNRGFSSLLQGRGDEAIADLVAALQKRPDLAAARTNLRLAIGMRGEYERALASAPQEDRAALLNNVGYAAMLRGDQANARLLFNQALTAKGQFYSRAAYNLETSTGLDARAKTQEARANVGP